MSEQIIRVPGKFVPFEAGTPLMDEKDIKKTSQVDSDDIKTEGGVLKFADKAYVPNDFSGMGRVYLRKNMINASLHFADIISDLPSTETETLFDCDEIVYETTNNRFLAVKHTSEGKKFYPNYLFTGSEDFSEPDNKHIYVCDANAKLYTYENGALEETTTLMDKNVLTQDMINKPNTIYIIQYDYDIVDKEDTTTTNNLTIGGEYYSYKPITIEDNQTYRALNDCVFINYHNNTLIGSVLVTGYRESQNYAIAKKSSAASGVPVSYYSPNGTINVPANCVLQYDGGSIKNGTINLNNTAISPQYNKLSSGDNLIITGSPAVGTQKYDEQSGMPLWWNGTAWVTFELQGYTQEEGKALEDEVSGRLDEQDAKLNLLNGNDVEVVEDHTLVANPDTQKIYREYGVDSYTDYMCTDNTTTPVTWQPIATYSYPGVDSTLVENSNKMVTSGVVYDKLILGKINGQDVAPTDIQTLDESNQYIEAKTDQDGMLLEGRTVKGEKHEFGDSIFHRDVKVAGDVALDTINGQKPVYKEEGKGLVDSAFADGVESSTNNEFIYAITVDEGYVVFGIKLNGDILLGKDGFTTGKIKRAIEQAEDYMNANTPYHYGRYLYSLCQFGSFYNKEVKFKMPDVIEVQNDNYMKCIADGNGQVIEVITANGTIL